jgi:predicted extracellular nuclease
MLAFHGIKLSFEPSKHCDQGKYSDRSPLDVLEGVHGAVKIARLNVLNFFTTLNVNGATTGSPKVVNLVALKRSLSEL